jgi:hypothetical protein
MAVVMVTAVMETVAVGVIDRPASRGFHRDQSCGPSIPALPPMSHPFQSGYRLRGSSPADHANLGV